MNSLLKSFGFAFQGIFHLIKKERNFKIQFSVFILVLFSAFYFQLSKYEWIVLLVSSMIVMSLEAINTSIEQLCDLTESNINPKIKIIKDVAAGAVLIASLFSIVIGLIIFIPRIYKLVESL
jgi:diacylglycerol kinase